MENAAQRNAPRLRLTSAHRAQLAFAALYAGDIILELPCEGTSLARSLRLSGTEGLRHAGACFDPETTRRMRAALPRSDLMYALAEELPWPAMSFDVVLGKLTPSLLAATRPLLAEILRVLKPGGQCVLAVPTLPGALRWLARLGRKGKSSRPAVTSAWMLKQMRHMGFVQAQCYKYSAFWLVAVGFGSDKAKFL